MEPGTVIAGRFAIVREVGHGGMGSVHLATDRTTDQPVAVKIQHWRMDEHVERFRREADALVRLSHPGIVGYVAHGEMPDGRVFLVMQWIEGETLAARLRRMGRLEPAQALELGACIADALAEAHAAGIVHRDVKPLNILLASDGFDHPVLVDFGVARMGQVSNVTQEGILIGTPGYISPEQARGLLKVDARADQFSLGCVLYACLTGRVPFRGEELVGVLAKILFQETPRIRGERRDVPLEVDTIVWRAMAKEPQDRFESAAAFASALRRAQSRLNEVATSNPTPSTHRGISTSESRLAAMVFVDRNQEGAADVGIRFGGDVERLASGGLAIRFIELAGATERAFAAARCALALRQQMPATTISLATVRGSGSSDDVVKAIDRAAELARDGPRSAPGGAHPIRIDETTAGLLDARFDVRRVDDGLQLVSERPVDEPRLVLGLAAPCIGRDRELLTLDATLGEVASEHVARAVIVTAEAGVGKSRLRREWMYRIRERGDDVTVWTARADPLDSRAPHGLLAQAIRRTVGIADDEPLDVRRQRVRDYLGRLLPPSELPRVLPFIAEMIGAPLDDDDVPQLAAARSDRKLMAEGIRRAFTTWIMAVCTKPLIIVLDDAHWSDSATLRLLDATLRAAADHPLLVVVLGRPALRTDHPELFAERRVQQLRLEELSKRSSERLARALLGPSVPASTIDRVIAASNGNAFFLEELLRAVAEGKGDVLPDSVLSVIEARLDALEPDARRVLRAASVFGHFFWPGGVAAVLGDTDEEAARTWIGALARREIVTVRSQSRFAGEPELTFRHALVRDTAYSMLTPEDRAIAHRVVASWLEAHGEQPAVLAAHLESGGDAGPAAKMYLKAASQMLGGGAVDSARELAARGLSCGPDPMTRAELLMVDADASRWTGDLEHATAAAEEVLLGVPRASDVYLSALGVAILSHLKLGRITRYRELAQLAFQAIEQSAPSSASARLAATTGIASLFGGELTFAQRINAKLEELVADADIGAPVEAYVHVFRAFLSDATGELEAQIRHFEAAASCHERIGDERSALLHRANAGFARTLIGDFGEAARVLFEVLAAARHSHLDHVRHTVHCHLSETLVRLGRFGEACEQAQEAIAGFRAQGDQRMEAASRAYLARALRGLGNLAGAYDELQASLVLARASRQIVPYVLATLADVEVDLGRTDDAVAHAEEAIAALEEVRTDGANELMVRLAHARALAAAGRAQLAAQAFEGARALFQQRLAVIHDEHLRACFQRIPEHATL